MTTLAAPMLAGLLALAAAPRAGPAAPPVSPSGTPAGAKAARAPGVLELRRPATPEWFGLYLMGKKAGWSVSSVRQEVRQGRKVVVASTESVVSGLVGGRQVQRSQSDEKVYEARPGGRLLGFKSTRKGDGGDRSVEGRCEGERCRALLVAEGQRQELPIPGVTETVEQADGARLAAARRGSVEGQQLDLEKLRLKPMRDRWVGSARVAAAGVQAEVELVEELEEGDRAATRVSIAPDGRIVELRLGDAVVARAEPEETAKRLDKVDLFALTRVKLPHALPRTVPGEVRYVLTGVPAGFQAEDPRQRWAAREGGAVELTVQARRPAAEDPAKDAARARLAAAGGDELLAPTPEVDADAPAIRRLAAEVVGSTPGTYAASVKLVHHVYRRLEKAYGVSRDRASEVLVLGKGDCTEHALLFTALARAAGIPARQVHGLVYARYDDGVDGLYWHAWVEVRSGTEWIAVDPTFDQEVADATHIVLGRGPQVDTVGLLGALQVASAEPVASP